MQQEASVYRYHLSGYIFETNVCIPELTPADGVPDCYIIVREGISPKVPAEALDKVFYNNEQMQLVSISKKQLGFIAIWNNNVLEYTPPTGTTDVQLKMLLLGSVSMIMASFLGYVSLHASSVIINDKAVLFCGQSGSGKSSLAGYFYARGYPTLSDDVTTLKIGTDGAVNAYPSVPRIKLSDAALESFGKTNEGLDTITGKGIKYAMPVITPDNGKAYQLRAIVLPVFEDGKARLEVVSGFRSKMELSKHIYRKRTGQLVYAAAQKEKVLFTIVTQIPMYTFYRAKEGVGMQENFSFIENELIKLLD